MKRKLRILHRYIGIFAAFWLLILATTGFLLQHSDDFNLSHRFIKSPWVLNRYGIGQHFMLFDDGKQQLVQLDKTLIINQNIGPNVTNSIIGAVRHEGNWLVATAEEIQWYNTAAELIQSVDAMDGLLTPLEKIGTLNNKIVYQSNNRIVYLTNNQGIKSMEKIKWSKKSEHKSKIKTLKQKALNLVSADYLSYEQFIVDIHAGIVTSKLINDFAALALIFLSCSGILLFFRKKPKSRS